MSVNERDYVAECPICHVAFLGATPDDVRKHVESEHTPLGRVIAFPERTPDSEVKADAD